MRTKLLVAICALAAVPFSTPLPLSATEMQTVQQRDYPYSWRQDRQKRDLRRRQRARERLEREAAPPEATPQPADPKFSAPPIIRRRGGIQI
jgi:hypothetical protein